jgi:hypothetical protein
MPPAVNSPVSEQTSSDQVVKTGTKDSHSSSEIQPEMPNLNEATHIEGIKDTEEKSERPRRGRRDARNRRRYRGDKRKQHKPKTDENNLVSTAEVESGTAQTPNFVAENADTPISDNNPVMNTEPKSKPVQESKPESE